MYMGHRGIGLLTEAHACMWDQLRQVAHDPRRSSLTQPMRSPEPDQSHGNPIQDVGINSKAHLHLCQAPEALQVRLCLERKVLTSILVPLHHIHLVLILAGSNHWSSIACTTGISVILHLVFLMFLQYNHSDVSEYVYKHVLRVLVILVCKPGPLF